MSRRRIVIIEDSTMLRQLLSIVLAQNSDFECVAEFDNGAKAIEKCMDYDPELIILDAMLPEVNGAEVCKSLLKQNPKLRVLGISAHQRVGMIRDMVTAGVHGFVFKEDSWEVIDIAINEVLGGNTYFSPDVARLMSEALTMGSKDEDVLTKRENEILRMIGSGLSVKEIAYELGLSPKTVNNHLTNLKNKLKIFDVPRLVIHAIKLGLVDNP